MTCSLVKRGIFMMLHLLRLSQPFSSLFDGAVQYLARIWFTGSV